MPKSLATPCISCTAADLLHLEDRITLIGLSFNPKPTRSYAMKFMGVHTFPAGGFSREQINLFAQAAQRDPAVKGYRSFVNLSEGKAVCIMEAADQRSVQDWFTRMGMPCDTLVPVELEGERGEIKPS
jgi:hypothetical protein